MKKQKKKLRLVSALLALLLLALYTVPATAEVIPGETASPNTLDPGYMQPLTSYQTEHSYDSGIVDGAVYYLRNVYNGQRMDVDGGFDVNGTSIHTYYDDHGGTNQQFRFHYIGDGLYEIVPAYTAKRLHISAEHNLMIHDKNWNSEQKFRIQMINNSVGVIFSQHGNFTRAITWDVDHPQCVVNKIYYDLADKTHAQWVFERVDNSADRYGMYYLRHLQTGLYLDVHDLSIADGAIVHTYSFGALSNQEWKFSFDDTNNSFYIMPGHRRDMALDYGEQHVKIRNGGTAGRQGFRVYQISNSTLDAIYYRIETIETPGRYLTLGGQPEYATVHHYVDPVFYGSNAAMEEDLNNLWVLEGVPHDATDPGALALNTWKAGKVEPGHLEEQPFYFTATETKQYKVELKNGNVDFMTIESETGVNAEILTRKNANGTRVANVYLQAGVTYCISVYSKNALDGNFTNFSIRIRELVAVGHSSMTDADGNRPLAAVILEEFSDAMENTDYRTVTRDNMSAAQALSEILGITGESYFNSDVFVYVGHGGKGYAVYDGTNDATYLHAYQLPNMSHLDLVVWACCYSADDPVGGDSLTTKTYNDGAETVIGWETEISIPVTKVYIEQLFGNLVNGATVDTASDAALDAVTDNDNLNVFAVALFIAALDISGNKNNTIVYSPNSATASANATVGLINNSITVDASKYTLIAENEDEGLKMYARTINGILVDDYYIEFYNNGVLTNVSKSARTITEADVAMIEAQIEQMENVDEMMHNNMQTIPTEYLIQCVDGNWCLTQYYSAPNDDCNCCSQYVYYNALTGEVISQ